MSRNRTLRRPATLGQMAIGGSRNIGLSRTGVDLSLGQFTIPQIALPYASPRNLIWKSIAEEMPEYQIEHLFHPWSNEFDSPSTGFWSNRIIDATKAGDRWFHGSDSSWGDPERDAIESAGLLFEYWAGIAGLAADLAKRQIGENIPARGPSLPVLSADSYNLHPEDRRYGFIVCPDSPGISQRWPIEVYAVAQALHLELRWAEKTFKHMANLNNDGILDKVVDGRAYTMSAGGRYVFADDISDKIDVLAGLGAGIRGGYAEAIAGTDPSGFVIESMGTDINEFVSFAGELFINSSGIQEAIVTPVKDILLEMATDLGDSLDDAYAFASTFVSDVTENIPLIGLIADIVIRFVDAWIDLYPPRKTETRFTISGLPRAPGVSYTHSGIERYIQMMYRALRLQEARITALLDGSSWLQTATGPKSDAVLPEAPSRESKGSSALPLVAAGAIGIGGVVWWLSKRR